MKKLNLLLCMALLSSQLFSENNKPAGAFGMSYGIGFNGGLAQNIRFSHWTKKNIEYGAGFSFSFSNSHTKTNDSVGISIVTPHAIVFAPEQAISKSNILTIGLSPFAAYHFPIRSILDVYLGGVIPLSITPG